MFTELLPVLKDRMVTITIARLDESLLRVNVLPKRKLNKESDTADNALSTPLTVTATAEELDREFARQVLSFSSSYERAASNIREIENAHAAAVKAAEDEGKNAKGRKPPTAPPGKAATRAESDSNAKPVFGNKTVSASAPAPQSLFDSEPADPQKEAGSVEPRQSPQPGVLREAATPAGAGMEATTTATAESDSLNPANGSRAEPQANAGSAICQICQGAILPSQKRHSVMPFPAHASATECEAARAGASAAGQSRE